MLINWSKTFTTGLGTYLSGSWFLNYARPFWEEGFYLGVATMDLQPMYWFSFQAGRCSVSLKIEFFFFFFFKATWFILFWDTTVWWQAGNPAIKIHSPGKHQIILHHTCVFSIAVQLNYNPIWFDHAVKVWDPAITVFQGFNNVSDK